MLRPSDQEYKISKKIKLAEACIDDTFKPLANWIDAKFHVKVLNIVTDTINGGTLRLQLIFEHQKDADKFLLKDKFSQSSRKGKTIAKKYHELFKNASVDSILVLIYAFEPLAREEAVTSMPAKIRDSFKDRYKDMLWEIAVFGEYVTFFFFSNEQLKNAQQHGTTSSIKEEFYALLKPYDRLNYLRLENFTAIFDSKENFDQNYDSNWRWYYS